MKTVTIIIASALAATLAASATLAAPFTIQTDDEVLFVRCSDMFGTASCDAIFPDLDEVYRCIAFDGDGKPLAVTSAIGGILMYMDLEASLVADIKCRR